TEPPKLAAPPHRSQIQPHRVPVAVPFRFSRPDPCGLNPNDLSLSLLFEHFDPRLAAQHKVRFQFRSRWRCGQMHKWVWQAELDEPYPLLLADQLLSGGIAMH